MTLHGTNILPMTVGLARVFLLPALRDGNHSRTRGRGERIQLGVACRQTVGLVEANVLRPASAVAVA